MWGHGPHARGTTIQGRAPALHEEAFPAVPGGGVVGRGLRRRVGAQGQRAQRVAPIEHAHGHAALRAGQAGVLQVDCGLPCMHHAQKLWRCPAAASQAE